MNKEKIVSKRLVIDIDEELHIRIKTAAAIKNISIKKYVLQNFLIALIEDEKNR